VREPNDQRFYRFFPSLRFKPSAKTELTINGEVLSTKSVIAAYGQGFTIMPAKFRRLFPATIGRASDPITALDLPWDFYLSPSELKEDVANLTAAFNHRFSDHVDFRQIVSYVSVKQYQEFYNSGGNLPDANPFDPTNANGLYKALLYDLNKIAEWRWNAVGDVLVRYGWDKRPFDLKFTTMTGYSITARDQESIARRYPIVGAARFLNLKNPQFSPVGGSAPLDRVNVGQLTNTLNQGETFSYYLQQEVSAWKDRVSLVYGWRDTRTQGSLTNYLNLITPKTETDNHPPASTRFAGSFKVRESISVYAAQSEQIDPAENTFVWGRLNAGDPRSLDVIVGKPSTKSTEFGVKGNLFANRIYFSLAYFKLVRTGTVDNESINVDSPAGSGNTVLATRRFLTDGDTSKGWEVELIGEVAKGLTLLASGSVNKTAQPDPTTVTAGDTRPIRFVPDWSANLFARYSFHGGKPDGLSVRAGANIIGPIKSSEVSNFGRLPLDKVQERFDVGASYAWAAGRYKVDLQISNVLDDAFFIVRVNNPREFRLSLGAKF
jgi:outer membrane receptor for ferric coprogen and ferric-rhodotorulic acid